MKNQSRFLSIILLFFAANFASAQNGMLSVEDIFSKGLYRMSGFGPARWLDDGAGYTTLERATIPGGSDIVRYDTKTGAKTVLVSAADLIPQNGSKPIGIQDYIWSDDKTKLLIFTNTRRVWRYNTRGDYWIFDLTAKKLTQLGISLEPTYLMFAKFSPDGKKAGYVYKQNIYVEDISSGKIDQLTKDGGGIIVNGTFDWVYEEELDCRDGFRWSPDSKYIAYWQLNTEGIGTFYMINNLDSVYPKLIPLPYPKVGTTNPAAKVGVIPATGGTTVWMKITGDTRNNYIPRIDFAASSNEIIIQHLNRLQNANDVMLGNIFTGDVRTIFTETDKAWVDIQDDLVWLEGGKYFTWNSEREGWRQIFKISRDGKQTINLTPGSYDVVSLLQVDQKNGYLYFIASPDNPTERYLFRTKMDGKGKLERLSPVEMTGQYSYQMSPDAKWAIHTFSNVSTPNTIDLVSLPAHKTTRILQNNDEMKKKYSGLNISQKEFFKVDIGEGIELYGWMIKPYNFDPSKKYPVIFNIYGEPAGSTVQNSFGGGDLWHQFLAQQGYVIMSVDNRGTAMPRGREWRKSIYGKIGIIAPEDHVKAVKKIIGTYKFVDAERIGIWGWSGGGSMTLNAMFRHPEIYKTGIAIAFVANQKFYDTVYQERYMGLPEANPDGFRDGSPITHAKGLKGNLLLIHGSGDDNVHYQNCEVLVNELIKQNKIFSMMEYPMRSHGINERENTTRHLYETMLWYWKNNLPAGGK
ncbi:MAG: S9 family peptidase [Odoribacter sp.]|nr:S9 family peptidase [Odoribacter sp.]